MNRAQRATLKVLLAVDLLLLVYVPYQLVAPFRTIDLGYHWDYPLSFLETDKWIYERGRINFSTLASQYVIVSLIGLTVFLLARSVTDEGFGKVLERLPILRRFF